MAHKTQNDDVIIEEGHILIEGVLAIVKHAKEEKKDMAKYSDLDQDAKDKVAAKSISKMPSLQGVDLQRKIVTELFKNSTPIIRKIRKTHLDDAMTEPNPDLGSFAETDENGAWTNLDGVTGEPVVFLDPANL